MQRRQKSSAGRAKSSGWNAAVSSALLLGTGAALCHLAFYPNLIVGVERPSIYRWLLTVSPLLFAAVGAGARVHSVHDWLAATVAGALVLQLYEFWAAQAHARPFLKSVAVEDPAGYWRAPFIGRLVGVACLLALAAGAVELARTLRQRSRE